VGDRPIEAKTLNNIGWAYAKLGQQQKALEYLNQALPIERNVGDKVFEAFTLRNIGLVYYDLGQKQKALEFYNRALLIQREMRAPLDEGYSLHSIGKATADLGDSTGALRNEMAALSLAKAVGDPDLQGAVDDSLMRYFRDQNRPEVAILFGMDAVNSYQQMRQNIFGLDKEIQTGFAQSKSATYRELAELLVQADRLGEAEQVLDLLKEQELKEVVRGASPDAAAKLEPLRLTAAQQSAQGDLAVPEKAAVAVTDLSVEYATLLAKPARTPAEEDRLKVLDAQIEAGNGEVSAFFRNTVYPELAQKVGAQDANALLSKEKSEVSRLQNTLAELGPRVMGIRLLLGDEHAYAILVTAHTREKFELKATPAELRSKVLQVRDDLRSPSSDSKPHLEELYAMVVAPLEVELNALERRSESNSGTVPTLLWSLDDVLRYLPMSALYDGRRYMVERFNNVLFTPESYGHMAAPPAPSASELRVLAMGLSRSYGGLPALPGVLPELDAVVHDPAVPESHGPLNGILLPNERFTYEALKSELGGGTAYPVVHIASHFVLEEGGGSEPYLMLGGESTGVPEGYPLTLSKLEDSSISFRGTRLLTLSACSTAKSDTAKNGMEMDSLGMVAQQKDAEAVLATLWDVSDASTSQLMSDFYSRWVKNQMQGKAEALRQAQLAFLRGPSAQATAGGDRGFKTVQPATAAPVAPGYSHPFYWAPFVLIGNYQ
jgi:CHAT domain-containing protein